MSQSKVTKILLDANVLYPAPIRDLLLNIACQGYYYPQWSGDIHREWSTNLLKNRPDIKPRQLERTILLMNEVFPEANVRNYKKLIAQLDLPDSNDRHVLAAAIKSDSKYIITFNTKDFPSKELDKYEIACKHPDDYILNVGMSDFEVLKEATELQLSALINPKISLSQLIDNFYRCGLEKSADFLLRNLYEIV